METGYFDLYFSRTKSLMTSVPYYFIAGNELSWFIQWLSLKE